MTKDDEFQDDALGVVNLISGVNAGRDPRVMRRKFDTMASAPFAFLRASAAVGHASLDINALPSSPLGWVTGDLHAENYGTFKGSNRLVYFDLNDFDESARLPLGIDIVRLLVSIRVAGREHGLDSDALRTAVRETLAHIGAALTRGKAFWLERDTARGPVRDLIDQVAARRRRDLVRALTRQTEAKRRLICDRKRILPIGDKGERRRVASAVAALTQGSVAGAVDILDVASRIAGKGSLGRPRYIVLARRETDGEAILLDLKAAAVSSAAASFRHPQPVFDSEAARIVAVQDRCQAVPPARLAACRVAETSFVLRALQPQEDRIDMACLADSPARLIDLFGQMGELAAYAYLRAAGRDGAAGPDELIAFGHELDGASKAWEAAASDGDVANHRAYATFRKAWIKGDPRLKGLCAPVSERDQAAGKCRDQRS